MLDVERRPDVDAGVAEFRDVLPALGVPRRRLAVDQVRVRQFVDQQDLGAPLQRGVEVELLAHHAAIADRLQRQAFQRLEHALGLATAVRLDVTDHDVGPRRLGRERRLEHRVGLADPRRSPEEDSQPPATRPRFLGLHLCEQSGPDPGGRRPSVDYRLSLRRARGSTRARSRAVHPGRPAFAPRWRPAPARVPALPAGRARAPRAAPGIRPRRRRSAGRGRCLRPSRDPPARAACCPDRPRAVRRCGSRRQSPAPD